ncbi:DUF2000 domain-containing protein [Nocardia sp. NPDC005825]|uniref:DUF2000 domain-containing protein n=1 Tax=unclassified Nocardia TaxID=2637762 RepID=UPI003407598B
MQKSKFVVVLNKNYDLARLASGLGHVTAGLSASLHAERDRMNFVRYESFDGETYPWISEWPFIVLRGTGGHIRSFGTELQIRDLPCVTYLDTMLTGGSDSQRESTSATKSDDLTPLAIATFGDGEVIDQLTKKFSLWK